MTRSVTARLKVVQATTDPHELERFLADPAPLVVEAAAPEGDPACRGRLAILTNLAELQAPEAAPLALRAIRTVQMETVGF